LQAVVNSGIPFVILRTGRTEGVDDSFGAESAVVLGAQQSRPAQASISKAQVTCSIHELHI
jgi:hypothetical protein